MFVIFTKSRSLRYEKRLHPSFTGPCRGLYQGQRQSSRDGIGNCQAGGMAFPWLSEWHTRNGKTSCRFGKTSCITDRSECDEFCNFYSKRWFGKHDFPWCNFASHPSPGSKERGGKRPHDSNPILCQGAWPNMVCCSAVLFSIKQFPQENFSCWTQGLLLNLNYPLLYWVAPNYEEFQ